MIAVSADSSIAMQSKAQESGFDHFLNKPVLFKSLDKVIKSCSDMIAKRKNARQEVPASTKSGNSFTLASQASDETLKLTISPMSESDRLLSYPEIAVTIHDPIDELSTNSGQ